MTDETTQPLGAARTRFSLGPISQAVDARLAAFDSADLPRRLFARDPGLWTDDEAVRRKIADRLGWLDLLPEMREMAPDLMAFTAEAREIGVQKVVLLGMGGSSLCPYVFRHTLHEGPPNLDLYVLDLTGPAAITSVERFIERPERTLFVVSSKSGGTIETLSFYRHFAARHPDAKFVAITDPGSGLEKLAREAGFHAVFHGRPDVGGRYSALSAFGLVPAALMGVKVKRLLDRAQAMHTATGAGARPSAERPGIRLGAILGEAALSGRDKLTFVMSPEIAPFGAWVEQLVAESTGKAGAGILPVDGESLAQPAAYGDDRLFAYLRLPGDAGSKTEQAVDALEAAGHPVLRFHLDDPYDLGAELLRWEIATAVAGIVLGINPFDEPNVTDAKERTGALLDAFAKNGRLPEATPQLKGEGLTLFADDDLKSRALDGALPDWLSAHLRRAKRGDYVSILAYLPETEETERALRTMQLRIRDVTGLATTVGFGPRYLHSTGQLHKGDGGGGLFLLLTADAGEAQPIPDAAYDFATLERAQALGDAQALTDNGRRLVHCHLADPSGGLQALMRHLDAALANVDRVWS
jgi:glucose-6-phosphate isomerase